MHLLVWEQTVLRLVSKRLPYIHITEILSNWMTPAIISISSLESLLKKGKRALAVVFGRCIILKALLLYCICKARTKLPEYALSCSLVNNTRSRLLLRHSTILSSKHWKISAQFSIEFSDSLSFRSFFCSFCSPTFNYKTSWIPKSK